jgi:catechol 2,3-dioxygenase-like lactoylglutathione lyase family enzyme
MDKANTSETVTIKHVNTILFVKDIALSRQFYSEVLDLKVSEDYGVIVIFENHFAIHQYKEIYNTVFKESPDGKICSKNLLVYLVSTDIDKSFLKLKDCGVEFIHGIEKQAWGERVFRFYDPDGHVIEIGSEQKWIQDKKFLI